MNEQQVLASIIILTKNGERYLRSLLDACFGQILDDRFEVVVIDSGSRDDTLRIVADYPSVRLYEIPPEEFGHGRTRNFGARLARGEFLVYIPQDATPADPKWLQKLLQPFSNPSVAGVYARQVPRSDASAMEKFFLHDAYPLTAETRSLAKGEAASLARCFFSTVSGSIRASLWIKHPFREDIIMSEDQAWASEAMEAGYAIAYAPDSSVLHSHQYGIADIFRRNFDSGYSISQIYAGKTGIPFLLVVAKLTREAVFILRAGMTGDRLRFIPYESARHMGFILGLHAKRLPIALRKKFSSLRYFWEEPSGNSK